MREIAIAKVYGQASQGKAVGKQEREGESKATKEKVDRTRKVPLTIAKSRTTGSQGSAQIPVPCLHDDRRLGNEYARIGKQTGRGRESLQRSATVCVRLSYRLIAIGVDEKGMQIEWR